MRSKMRLSKRPLHDPATPVPRRLISRGPSLSGRAGGLLRSALAPGIAVLVAGAALVFQAPQLVDAVAQGCVTPGNDGPNAALTGVVNTYYPATASAASGAASIAVGARLPPPPPPLG